MKIIYLLLSLVLLINVVSAGDEQGINKALSENQHVLLDADRVYSLEGPIYIHSNNVLEGQEGTILRVSSSSSQWFGGRIGIISNMESIHNVWIKNLDIDGNCDELPSSYANTATGIHDAERGIYINGFTNDFCTNIHVENVRIYDTFSDGVHYTYVKGGFVDNYFGSNNQHDSVFFVCVLGGSISNFEIGGITSDCFRLDNCQNVSVKNGLVYSYTGSHSNNAYQHGENGGQLGDESNAGGKKGGTAKPWKTQNIEVTNVTFANNGLKAIMLDNVELASAANIFIHDNTFVGKEQLETSGVSVGNYSYENMPSKEVSEQVFSSIFDILNLESNEADKSTQAHLKTKSQIEQAHNESMALKIEIPNRTYLFIGVVLIFLLGTLLNLKGLT